MARYKAIIEYDGSDFAGFQRQAPTVGPTVQGEVEAALARISDGKPITIMGAGRTDSGVHASGQVIAFELAWAHGAEALIRALNANLPRAIAALSVSECAADFHPRFSAQGRRYCYSIYNAPIRSPLRERFAWQVWPALDVAAMQAASQHLLGRHDFGTFGTAPEPGGHTARTVREARWEQSEGGQTLNFYIEADAFLYRMVRSIVGTLKQVGQGERTAADFVEAVQASDRSRAGTPAPPNGLRLIEVIY
ncbi:MAG: tRNA pseudouridine(38-40) synthase TruA [Chloroflexi bacterium]|nr:tRNA pseudouridine(38-40) synthase TruA [Chloroflexota bacterium]